MRDNRNDREFERIYNAAVFGLPLTNDQRNECFAGPVAGITAVIILLSAVVCLVLAWSGVL